MPDSIIGDTTPDSTVPPPGGGKGRPWLVAEVAGGGNVLVAGRDIAPWELVLRDTALVVGPDNSPVCVGCHGKVGLKTRLLN